jgi:hypothetical protein
MLIFLYGKETIRHRTTNTVTYSLGLFGALVLAAPSVDYAERGYPITDTDAQEEQVRCTDILLA